MAAERERRVGNLEADGRRAGDRRRMLRTVRLRRLLSSHAEMTKNGRLRAGNIALAVCNDIDRQVNMNMIVLAVES